MPDTFGGEWHRPTSPQRGHSRRQLQDRASYDNQPANDCLSSLFFLSILATAAVASIRRRN
ncbi:hypothetical protein ABZ904_08590 [Streptomyces sp. NPDC046900]|uniref:hypothetical protein n=1 Tax=Streptomyces sp. NPDC046900 TaxID=3155473 RepID=UPI00340AE716